MTGWGPCSPLFSTAYIMLGAGRLLAPDAIGRAAAYIRGQRRADGLWDYDPELRIPPDSDCTACALAALALCGASPEGAADAALLRAFWRPGGGPFQTWNVPGQWSIPERDDAVVNCNIVLALRLLGSPATPEELDAVRQLVGRSEKGSRFYYAPSTIAHAASRAGLGWGVLPPVAAARPQADDLVGYAQWLCALPDSEGGLTAPVLAAQRPDGSWPTSDWVTGESTPKPFWGSSAVTTALAVEALARHARL